MSLFPKEPQGSGRSRSRSRDRRSKDESNPETPSSWADIREPSYVYPEDDFDDRYKRPSEPSHSSSGALPYPEEGGIYSMLPGNQSMYNYDSQPQQQQQPIHRTVSPTQESSYRSSREKQDAKLPGAFPEEDRREKPNDPRIRFAEPPRDDKYSRRDHEEEDKLKYLPQKYAHKDDKDNKNTKDSKKKEEEDKLKYLPQKYIRKYITGDSDSSSSDDEDPRRTRKDKDEDDLAYGKPSIPRRPKKDNTELAYGKGAGVPSASEPSSKSQQATYGSYVSGDKWDDKRDEKRTSTYGSRGEDYDQRRPTDPSAPVYGQYSTKSEASRHDDPSAPAYGQYYSKSEAQRQEGPDQRRPGGSSAPEYSQYYGGESSRKDDRKGEGSAAEYVRASQSATYGADPRGSNPNVLTVDPGSRDRDRSRDRRREKSPTRDTLKVDSGSRHREKSRERSRDRRRDKSPGPRSSGDTLTVDSGHKHKHR